MSPPSPPELGRQSTRRKTPPPAAPSAIAAKPRRRRAPQRSRTALWLPVESCRVVYGHEIGCFLIQSIAPHYHRRSPRGGRRARQPGHEECDSCHHRTAGTENRQPSRLCIPEPREQQPAEPQRFRNHQKRRGKIAGDHQAGENRDPDVVQDTAAALGANKKSDLQKFRAHHKRIHPDRAVRQHHLEIGGVQKRGEGSGQLANRRTAARPASSASERQISRTATKTRTIAMVPNAADIARIANRLSPKIPIHRCSIDVIKRELARVELPLQLSHLLRAGQRRRLPRTLPRLRSCRSVPGDGSADARRR